MWRGWPALLALLLALIAAAAHAAPSFPPLTGRVTDAAGVLPADIAASLTDKLAALETATGTQLVVATVPDLQGNPIEDYGYQLGRAWGIGQKGKNTGVILLVAPTERKVRIEVGYGLEDRLTDALSETIIRDQIVPYFKNGDLPGGVIAGTDALIAQLQADPATAKAALADAAAPRQQAHSSRHFGFGGLVWVAIILLWLFFSIFRRRRSSGLGEAILWGVASGIFNNRGGGGGWGSGGGGGWGGGGGGGFSGGGGSFGGGGASGSW